MHTVGKTIADETYVHVSAISLLPDAAGRELIDSAMARSPDAAAAANVVKFNTRAGRVSLLDYGEFEETPFPILRRSWSQYVRTPEQWAYRSYEDSLNPPILHRKELLVSPDHPRRGEWTSLTKAAENLGLFDDVSTIGFLLNWERLIASKGYQLIDGSFVPLANDVPSASSEVPGISIDRIQRHLTALSRTSLSAPAQLLLRHGLLTRESSFFDYGCGRGDDMSTLLAEGFSVGGWDPHYAPGLPIREADIVNLGFVVNVIDDPAERVEALRKAFALTQKVMSVGVMLHSGASPGRPYRDGFLTSRNTFQKYFSQDEFKDYLEHVLAQEAFLVGPGVAFVFADKELEQRFVAERYRARDVAARLLSVQSRTPKVKLPRPPRVSRAEQFLDAAKPTLDGVWRCTLELGRYPDPAELPNLEQVSSTIGSHGRAYRLVAQHYDASLLEAAARARADDLRVYFAMQQFSRRARYRQLEPRLQRDIKAFFGDYATAQAAGLKLLMQAAEPAEILSACKEASTKGLGWLEGDHSLQVHVSLVERLPAVLRAFVGCGLILYGALGDVELIKIHVASGKLTLMEFDNFADGVLPRMSKRVKVNVRKLDYDIFEYGSTDYPKPLLYRKSRFMHEDMPGYPEQLAFDEALEATGVLGESEFGPAADELAQALDARRLAVNDGRLGPSRSVPDLDAPCGAHFRYRDFIDCGETQQRLGHPNKPKNPETYNALHALATQLLDPLIDYFGAIRLTYGFCSEELGRHIKTRVAPKLDQHASHEINRRGLPICARGGAACDFIVDDEDMREVADWILANLPFDRVYFYGPSRPLHVSWAANRSGLAYEICETPERRLIPRRYGPRAN